MLSAVAALVVLSSTAAFAQENLPRLGLIFALDLGKTDGAPLSEDTSLVNPGPGPAIIQKMEIQGRVASAFSVSSKCPLVLEQGESCDITVKFSPLNAGFHQALLLVTPKGGAPAKMHVVGRGLPASAKLSSRELSFSAKSPTKSVTLTNSGSTTLPVYAIAVTEEKESFRSTNKCPALLQPGASCDISVEYRYQHEGLAMGILELYTGNSGGPQFVKLYGDKSSPER
ncbi:hypothetical protein C7414_101586 [Cupriavidus alkaliphilus]|nr:hypothetical protein C7414_101586 [Cupriavidus alkaliphilus]SCB06929.1 hypothetical protein GA0116996_10151 [Cupriavidus alkaliphilus]